MTLFAGAGEALSMPERLTAIKKNTEMNRGRALNKIERNSFFARIIRIVAMDDKINSKAETPQTLIKKTQSCHMYSEPGASKAIMLSPQYVRSKGNDAARNNTSIIQTRMIRNVLL
jgi:hypothetical protein